MITPLVILSLVAAAPSSSKRSSSRNPAPVAAPAAATDDLPELAPLVAPPTQAAPPEKLVPIATVRSPNVPADAPRIAVMDFAAQTGASADLGAVASGLAATELERLALFQVTTAETLRQLLAVQRQQELMGCAEGTCLDVLGNATDAQYVLTGKVSRIGSSQLSLELTLIDLKTTKRLASDFQTVGSEAALISRMGPSIYKVVAPLLHGKQGTLLVSTSEAGATVKVDDQLVGVTPLSRIPLAAGPHLVQLEKAGFVSAKREIRIRADEVAKAEIELVPSPDFIQAYESSASRMRVGAWTTTALAVAGVAALGYFQFDADRALGAVDRPGTFEYHRAKVLAGIEVEGDVDHRGETRRLKSRIQSDETFALVGGAVGVASAAAATYFWIAGDAPGRYGEAPASAVPQVSVGATPEGAFGSATFRF